MFLGRKVRDGFYQDRIMTLQPASTPKLPVSKLIFFQGGDSGHNNNNNENNGNREFRMDLEEYRKPCMLIETALLSQ